MSRGGQRWQGSGAHTAMEVEPKEQEVMVTKCCKMQNNFFFFKCSTAAFNNVAYNWATEFLSSLVAENEEQGLTTLKTQKCTNTLLQKYTPAILL